MTIPCRRPNGLTEAIVEVSHNFWMGPPLPLKFFIFDRHEVDLTADQDEVALERWLRDRVQLNTARRSDEP